MITGLSHIRPILGFPSMNKAAYNFYQIQHFPMFDPD